MLRQRIAGAVARKFLRGIIAALMCLLVREWYLKQVVLPVQVLDADGFGIITSACQIDSQFCIGCSKDTII